MSDAIKARRGRKATRFGFSDEQRELIDSYIPAFEAAVRELNPGLNKCNDKLAKWKSDTAESIMSDDLFKDIEEGSEGSRKEWLTVSLWHWFRLLVTEHNDL
jgi:hypothetical protein